MWVELIRQMNNEEMKTSHRLHYGHDLEGLIYCQNDVAFGVHTLLPLLGLKLQLVDVAELVAEAYSYLQHPDLCVAFRTIVVFPLHLTKSHGREKPFFLHSHLYNTQLEPSDDYVHCHLKMRLHAGYDMQYQDHLVLDYCCYYPHLMRGLAYLKPR